MTDKVDLKQREVEKIRKRGKTPTNPMMPIEEIVDKLRPIDDCFFHKLAEQRDFCEELLQTLLTDNSIQIKEHTAQKSLRNVKGKSVTTDLLCQDKERVMYGVEMQRKDRDDQQKRVRYIGSNIDTYITEKGIDYEQLWDLHMIYISEFDMFKKEKTIYHINRMADEFQGKVENGYDEIYVNTAIDDGSDIAELMQIFKSPEIPDNPKFSRICKAIRHFKTGRGRMEMCEMLESYVSTISEIVREEGREEGIDLLLDVIGSLKAGKGTEELKKQGYDEILIQKANLVLSS